MPYHQTRRNKDHSTPLHQIIRFRLDILWRMPKRITEHRHQKWLDKAMFHDCPRGSDSIFAKRGRTSVQNDEHVIFDPDQQFIKYVVEART